MGTQLPHKKGQSSPPLSGDGAGNTTEENSSIFSLIQMCYCLQCFDTVGWVAGRASGLQRYWGMVEVDIG